MAFAKFKELLRQAQARTVDALWDLIARTLNLFTPPKNAATTSVTVDTIRFDRNTL